MVKTENIAFVVVIFACGWLIGVLTGSISANNKWEKKIIMEGYGIYIVDKDGRVSFQLKKGLLLERTLDNED